MKARMTPGCEFVARLTQIMRLVGELPVGAEVTVSWPDAPPDLLLVLAHNGAELRDGEIEWAQGNLTIRARGTMPDPKPRPKLRLV